MQQAPFREGKRGETETRSVPRVQGRSIYVRESILWAFLILCLCVADTVLTLGHISRGAHELNPLMAYVLAAGPGVFVGVKMMVSVFALAALSLFLPRYRLARACFGSIGALYGALVVYHLALIP
jgi:hypothetical protein